MTLTQRELTILAAALTHYSFSVQSSKYLAEVHALADRVVANQEPPMVSNPPRKSQIVNRQS